MKLIWINFFPALASAAVIRPVDFRVRTDAAAATPPAAVSALGRTASPRLPDLSLPAPAIGAAPIPLVQSAENGGSEEAENADSERTQSDKQEQEPYARIRERRREQEAVRYKHEQRPVLDYRNNVFDAETARQFADDVRRLQSGRSLSGRDLLRLILTDYAARPDLPLDLRFVDPAGFGRCDAELREKLAAQGITPWEYDDFLKAAFHRGVIYRINDSRRNRTYYGIPPQVREALRLDPAFRSNLLALIEKVRDGDPNDELFEYAALAAEAAVRAGRMDEAEMPPAFEKRVALSQWDVPPLSSSLLTLLEASHGTPLFPLAEALCAAAVDDGDLAAEELQDLQKEWPGEAPAAPAASSRFGGELRALTLNPAKQQKDAPGLFKLLAQTVAAAAREGLIDPATLSSEFVERSGALGLEEAPLESALPALLRASRGTLWEETIADLYDRAAAEGRAPIEPRENRR